MTLDIRRFRREDHDAVWALHKLALQDVGADIGDGEWDRDLDDVEGVYLDRGGEFLVGTVEGSVVAMGALVPTSPGRAEVKRMRVHPDFQRRGFGRAILRRLEQRAVEFGYAVLHLATTVGQLAAQKLYEKNGYVETGRTRVAGFDVILYEKELQ